MLAPRQHAPPSASRTLPNLRLYTISVSQSVGLFVCLQLRTPLFSGCDLNSPLVAHAQGANAPFSGLVATLAAAQILGAAGGGAGGAPGADYTRHVVFTALAGETWGWVSSLVQFSLA